MEIDPRAWTAATLAVLALWLAMPREDALLVPQRRRTPLEWLRYRLARPQRDAQEEREATAFLARMKDPDLPPYRIRQRDLPSANRRIPTALLADGGQPPWGGSAPYAPDPEDEPQERPQEEPQDDAREEPQDDAREEPQERAQEPERAQEDPQVPLPELRAWSPGDPGRTPTGVLQKITPEVERQLRPYLRTLPRYKDEPRQ